MRKNMFLKTLSILCLCCGTVVVSTARGETKPESHSRSRESLNLEKSNLEKLNIQLRILEMEAREDALRPQKDVALTPKPDVDEQEEGEPVVINPNEDVMITKEMGEYDVPVYSIETTLVPASDILNALSASMGKSIIIDEDVDPMCLSQPLTISIPKSPLLDILEIILGTRGLEFTRNDNSIYVTSLSKLNVDTASEYYRDKGARLYQKTQIKFPSDQRVVNAYFALGNYYQELGFHFLALQEYKIILDKYKNSPLKKEVLFKVGHCYDNLKDPENARKVYFRFIYSYPGDPLTGEALLAIGNSFQKQGLYTKALDVYDKVILEYTDAETVMLAKFNAAKTHEIMGDYKNAIQSFLLARKKCPIERLKPEIEYHIGSCLYLLGEYQDAGNVLGNLLESYDEEEFNEDAGFLLGDCFYKQDDIFVAFQMYKKMVSEYPKSDKAPHGTYWLGKCLNAMNMHESAVNVLSEGVQKFPNDWYAARMALEIGRCYVDGGNYRAAYNVFDSFVKQYPNDELRIEGLLGMADAFFHDKEYEKAINHYLALIKEDCGENVKNYSFNRIGDCYKSLGQLEKATMAYNTVPGKGEGDL
ncbi:MAG: tetratricopeptide repeat protein, partial [Planctomycetota bacterium]